MKNLKAISSLALSLPVSLWLQGCGQTPPSNASAENALQGKLTVTGSSTVAPLASEIAKQFEAENPNVRIDVQTGGSSRGLADASQGLADIGMVSRALKVSEAEELKGFVVARDGIGIIVHTDNPVTEMSDLQIVQIYNGEIENWQGVGGKDAAIAVVNKAEGRSTLELFLKYFKLENAEIEADTVIGDNQQGIKTVAGNPNAIAYVSIGSAEYEIERGVPIKLLPVGGVVASTETVKDGSFPLSRSLTLVAKGEPTGLTQEFLEFAQSEDAHDLIREQNFIPLEAEEGGK